MPVNESVRTHITITTETWDQLARYILRRYGKDRRLTSVTIEQAIIEFLDKHESETPAT